MTDFERQKEAREKWLAHRREKYRTVLLEKEICEELKSRRLGEFETYNQVIRRLLQRKSGKKSSRSKGGK